MKKKRKGSTILMVLMVSTVFIILSMALSTGLISSAINNGVVKMNSDYTYAAEGGLELGIEKFRECGDFGSISVPFLRTILEDPNKGIKDVEVKVTSENDKTYINSTVYGKDDNILKKIRVPVEKKAKSTLGRVLFNSIYSTDSVKLTPEAPVNFTGTIITYEKDKDLEIRGSGSQVLPKDKDIEAIPDLSSPEFKQDIFTRIETTKEINSIKTLWKDPNTTELDVTSLDSEIVKVPNGVAKFEIDDFDLANDDDYIGAPIHKPLLGSEYKVLLIDAPELKIDVLKSESINKYIIICSGKITITSDTIPTPQLNVTEGTLYGDNVFIEGTTNITMSGAPINANTIYGNYLRADQIMYLDKIMDKYMSNWGTPSTDDGEDGDIDVDFGELQYDNF